ncbi:Abi family protein [Alloscardovia omnicolens]|uniref:Abi family protein n=1 Tax=Alloscardovia omnicolens TaxID=419015 RepID=UPI003A6B471D
MEVLSSEDNSRLENFQRARERAHDAYRNNFTNDFDTLNTDEQIEYFKRRGITFERYSEDKAKTFMLESTYFFKLKILSTNFTTDPATNTFTNLDFAQLRDVSILDYHLRSLINYLSSNIEHALRVRFNRVLEHFDDDSDEATRPYIEYRSHGNPRYDVSRDLSRSIYTSNLIEQYDFAQMKPIWLLWEAGDFSTLITSYRAYIRSKKLSDIIDILFNPTRKIRNAAAHHNSVLVPTRQNSIVNAIVYLANILIPWNEHTESAHLQRADIVRTIIQDQMVSQFAALLLVHVNLVTSTAVRQSAIREVKDFLSRLEYHWDWYTNENSSCPQLTHKLTAVKTLLESFCSFMEALDDDVLNEDEQLLLLPPTDKAETAEVLLYMEECFVEDVSNDIHKLNEMDKESAGKPQLIDNADTDSIEEKTEHLSNEEMLAQIMQQINDMKENEERA